ncbi:MAG: AEC family transporter [Desulfopila sp.]
MEVVTTIIPIFVIILLGWFARKRGFITGEFLEPANQLVYYLSIPALIFNSITKVPFHEQFNGTVLAICLAAIVACYAVALLITRCTAMTSTRAGVFVLNCSHGNVGYIGLPTVYYYLGQDGLARAGIVCGFIMVLQNLLSTLVLQLHERADTTTAGWRKVLLRLGKNPVIIGAASGIVVSFAGVPIPSILGRVLDILGGLAPPMALLLIGASLSIRLLQSYLRPVLATAALKLVVLPALAVALFGLFQVPTALYLPALILLCSPTATIVYVMAHGMHGDGDFAVAAISASTLFSLITFIGWLTVMPLFGP